MKHFSHRCLGRMQCKLMLRERERADTQISIIVLDNNHVYTLHLHSWVFISIVLHNNDVYTYISTYTYTSAPHLQTILPCPSSVMLCLDLSQHPKIPKAVCRRAHLGVSRHMPQTNCHQRRLHVKEAQQDMFRLSDCVYPPLLLEGLYILSIARNVTYVVGL